jgi:hypothetical protein
MILEANAIEQLLPGRQPVEQRLGGEVGLRQRVDKGGVADGLEAVGGRDLDMHARGPVGARPDDGGIGRHVARLDAMRDERPVDGAAQGGLGDDAGGTERRRRSRSCQ